MKRVNIIFLLAMIFCSSINAQNFSLFDEKCIGDMIVLTPKGKDSPVLEGDQKFRFEVPYQKQSIREKATIFFRIFEPLRPEEREIMRNMWAEIYFTKELKMNYYEITIPKQDRDFFFKREQKLEQWLQETYSDMSKNRKDFNIENPETFIGGHFHVLVYGFYRNASDLLKE